MTRRRAGGGVLVGLIYWFIYLRGRKGEESGE